MKLTLSAILALSAIAIMGTQTGPLQSTLTEYDAVSADGPYSYLPTSGHGTEPTDIAELADLDGNPEIVTAEEAQMTSLLLDVLAGDPIDTATDEAPLDRPVLSDTEIVLAGL